MSLVLRGSTRTFTKTVVFARSFWDAQEILRRATYLSKIALKLWPRPEQVPEEAPAIEKLPPASFHADCIRLVQQHLKANLSKLSKTRYASGDGLIKLVCAVSAEHNESSDVPYYWFARSLLHDTAFQQSFHRDTGHEFFQPSDQTGVVRYNQSTFA